MVVQLEDLVVAMAAAVADTTDAAVDLAVAVATPAVRGETATAAQGAVVDLSPSTR
jgi:hypothetical protein